MIVKPNFGCNTRSIYSRVNKFSRSKYNKPSIKLFDLENMKKSKNDLEPIAFKKYPKLKMIKFSLINFPNVIFTRMTGSGSSILGYFKTKRACAAAYKQLRKEYKNCWCIVSKTI